MPRKTFAIEWSNENENVTENDVWYALLATYDIPDDEEITVYEIETLPLDCSHCGGAWQETETILPDGELGCACQADNTPTEATRANDA